MANNAIEIAQNIARSVGFPAPATLLTNTNQDAIRLLQSINDAGRFLARYDWNSLVVETTISCSASADTYAVPTDLRAIVPMTIWQQSASRPTAGPVRHVEWQANKYGAIGTGIADRFHLRYLSGTNLQRILISPMPADGQHFVYLYRRLNWVYLGAPTLFGNAIAGDNNLFLIDDWVLELDAKWRFLRALGQPYGEEKNEANDARQKALAEDGGMEPIGGETPDMPYFTVPDRDYQQ